MGCTGSKGGADDEASADLEKELCQFQLESLFCFKILLLGAGESGKSTVVKQMRLIHNKKQSKQELNTIADSLHQNVIDCMKALLYACQKFGYDLDDAEDEKTAEEVMNFDEGTRLTYDFGEGITRLYNSDAVRKAYGRRDEYWLLDSCSYYMKNLDRFTEMGFMPTEEDSVMARIRTTGIVVSDLVQRRADAQPDEPKELKFQVVDVGGQRNERKKWMHCFDDVKGILFIVNLAGYNQVLFEDTSKNRMHEALELFSEICNKPAFLNTPMFLFLNKKDLFEIMIKNKDLKEVFDEYDGGLNLLPAVDFITKKFMAELPGNKELQTHVVTSVWKRDIKCSFEEVKKKLIESNQKAIDAEKLKLKKITKSAGKKKGGCM